MAIKIYIRTDKVLIILAKKNMNRTRFAHEVGVDPSAVTRWMAHDKCPSEKHRERIQEVLGRTRQWDTIFIMTGTAEDL